MNSLRLGVLGRQVEVDSSPDGVAWSRLSTSLSTGTTYITDFDYDLRLRPKTKTVTVPAAYDAQGQRGR